MAKTYKATLKRGAVYYLGNTRWNRGETKTITQADKDVLDIEAVDTLTVADGDEVVTKPKFSFEEVAEPVRTRPVPDKKEGGGE